MMGPTRVYGRSHPKSLFRQKSMGTVSRGGGHSGSVGDGTAVSVENMFTGGGSDQPCLHMLVHQTDNSQQWQLLRANKRVGEITWMDVQPK